MNQLRKDYEHGSEPFNPIFVAVTWESEWAKLPSAGSFANKGNDADEIGFTWANYLLNVVLKPIAKESRAQLVGIGHSFGSRIILGSHYVRSILAKRPSASDSVPVTLIGMQAAFPTGRFISARGGEHPYLSANKEPATVVITTSKYDGATGTMESGILETGYIGGPGGLTELQNHQEIYDGYIKKFDTARDGGAIGGPDSRLVSVYDASPFVNCELPGTESGSHSDVYDEEMGHFLGQMIRATARPR